VKPAILLFLAAIWAPWPAAAGQCAEAEKQLQTVSRALESEALDKAEQALESVEKYYPNCPESLLDHARLLALKGNTVAAAEAFTRYQELAPDDGRGYAYLARLLLEQGQYQRADETSVLGLEKKPNDPAALAVRGEILIMKGQVEEATNLLEQALQLDPDNVEANFQLGTLADENKRHAEAAKHFEKVLAVNGRDAQAWDYLALNVEVLGEVARAQNAYLEGEAINQPGRHFDSFLDYNYGRFLTKRNQLNGAKQHLDHAVELAPEVRAVWYDRAKVNLLMKNYEDARSDAERAAALPDTQGVILDLQVYALLGQIYGRLGNQELSNKYDALSRVARVPVQEGR
jgi:tetratricopeptide (TPR) repeat protein